MKISGNLLNCYFHFPTQFHPELLEFFQEMISWITIQVNFYCRDMKHERLNNVYKQANINMNIMYNVVYSIVSHVSSVTLSILVVLQFVLAFKWFSTVADQKIVVGVSKEIKLPKLILFNGMSATYNYWNNLNRQHPNNLVQSEGEINRLKLQNFLLNFCYTDNNQCIYIKINFLSYKT